MIFTRKISGFCGLKVFLPAHYQCLLASALCQFFDKKDQSRIRLTAPELEQLSKGSLPRDIPCVRLVMLGVEKSLQRQGISKKMMSDALHRVHRAAKEIGVYGLYLDADPAATDSYLSLGFIRLDEGSAEEIAKMFLSIETINQVLG